MPYRFTSYIQHAGMTLIELMVVLSILTLLLSLTLPQSHALMAQNRLSGYMTQLYSQVFSARAYAIYHNEYVSVCSSVEEQCVTNNSHAEIMVFVDNNKDLMRQENDAVLYVIAAPLAQDSITYSRAGVTFTPQGAIVGFNSGSFVYCSSMKELNQPSSRISVSQAGRIRLRKDENRC